MVSFLIKWLVSCLASVFVIAIDIYSVRMATIKIRNKQEDTFDDMFFNLLCIGTTVHEFIHWIVGTPLGLKVHNLNNPFNKRGFTADDLNCNVLAKPRTRMASTYWVHFIFWMSPLIFFVVIQIILFSINWFTIIIGALLQVFAVIAIGEVDKDIAELYPREVVAGGLTVALALALITKYLTASVFLYIISNIVFAGVLYLYSTVERESHTKRLFPDKEVSEDKELKIEEKFKLETTDAAIEEVIEEDLKELEDMNDIDFEDHI